MQVPLELLPRGYERDPDRYFGVPVSGDSMEPDYHDGDILIVKNEIVDVGDIVVAVMNGEGYVGQRPKCHDGLHGKGSPATDRGQVRKQDDGSQRGL